MYKIMCLSIVFVFFSFSNIYACGEHSAPPKAEKISVETLIKSTVDWQGNPLPAYPQGQPEVTVLKITIPAGKQLPKHYHPFINTGILVKGHLKITDVGNQKTVEIKPGNSIAEIVDRVHYCVNLSDEDAEIIVFYAGIEGKPVTILAEAE